MTLFLLRQVVEYLQAYEQLVLVPVQEALSDDFEGLRVRVGRVGDWVSVLCRLPRDAALVRHALLRARIPSIELARIVALRREDVLREELLVMDTLLELELLLVWLEELLALRKHLPHAGLLLELLLLQAARVQDFRESRLLNFLGGR